MTEQELQIEQPSAPSKAVKSAFEWMEMLITALVLVGIIFALFFRVVGVEGESMINTLQSGDRLILTKLFYTPSYGDIVVIRREQEKPLIKRVIAVAGDTVDINEELDQVTVNGEVLNEPYVEFPTLQYQFIGPKTVPENCVFVMGDHRNNSHDSRMNDIGFVNTENIIGKAVFRIMPFSSFGTIYKNMP